MKILFVYFTGTYNTRYVTRLLSERFTQNGDRTETLEITSDAAPCDTDGYDMIGFGYPIYGFNSPLVFNKFVSKLNFRKGQKFFIYKNSGETFALNNASSRILLRRCRAKKMDFCGEYHFIMPYNIHFPFERAFVRELLQKNDQLAEVLCYNVSHGIVHSIKSNVFYNAAAAVVGVQKIGGPVNSFFYRVDESKCVDCGLCVRDCPTANIVRGKRGGIKFRHSCAMCMRCSFFCPTDAIHIGFLQKWKVNGDYRLDKIAAEPPSATPYITDKSKGFYKCFIKSYREIDAAHERVQRLKQKEEEATLPPLKN